MGAVSVVQVKGAFDDGSLYSVRLTGQRGRPVVGSQRIAEMFTRLPDLDGTNARAVLAVLESWTTVMEVTGQVPAPAGPPRPAGAVH